MARRFIAASFAAVVLGVLGAPAVSAQVSPPTSAALRTGVVKAAEAPAPSGLARTGGDPVPAAALGLGLAGVGAGLVVVARRQRPAATD